jgi:hypothetical protein
MTADVIDFPAPTSRNPGNGAREALIEVGVGLPNTGEDDARRRADWMLAELWSRGFKVVPLDGSEPA